MVAAGPTGVVTLRNLRINGIASGLNGIVYQSGAALHVENCNIFGFTGNGTTTGNGINVVTSTTAALFVNNTFLTNNNNGVQIAPSAAFARSVFVQVQVLGNIGFGFHLNPSGSGGGTTIIDNSSVLSNATGIGMSGGTLYLGNSVIIRNNIGVAVTGGTALSYKTNMINGNSGGDGTPLTGLPLN